VIKLLGKVIWEVNSVPNIKSSIRSVKTDAKRHEKNAPIKASVRGISRKVETLAATGKKDEAQAALATAKGIIDNAARRNVLHKNAASRKKSRLAKKVNAMK
jgi:small subunit ribosomal protein S20